MLSIMRTTLDIADDVLNAARAIAERDRVSLGEAISRLARTALTPARSSRKKNGIALLPPRSGAKRVTSEQVAELVDEP